MKNDNFSDAFNYRNVLLSYFSKYQYLARAEKLVQKLFKNTTIAVAILTKPFAAEIVHIQVKFMNCAPCNGLCQ